MPKIVFATVEELFSELHDKGIKGARIESVVTEKTDKATKIRQAFRKILIDIGKLW